MGTCLSHEYILGQEAINSQLRQDVARALECANEFQNSLATVPKRQEEVEAIRQSVAQEREIKELKLLLSLRTEVDALKATLKADPSLMLSEIQIELSKLQDKITALKGIKSLANELTRQPPFACLKSLPEGDEGGHSGFEILAWKEGAFKITNSITLLNSGLYQISAIYYIDCSYRSGTSCLITVNGIEVASQPTNCGTLLCPTHVLCLIPLQENDEVNVRIDTGGYDVEYFEQPTVTIDMFMIQG